MIEISDDSDSEYKAGTSGSKQPHTSGFVDLDSDEESDESSDSVQWVEEESESEPDLDCDHWDDDCTICDLKPSTKLIQGYHLMPTCIRDLPEKRMKMSAELNDVFCNSEYVQKLCDNFQNGNAFIDKECEMILDPWKVLVCNDVVSNVDVLNNVREEFNEISWNERKMDLYEFFQSRDLRKEQGFKNINCIYELIKGDLMKFVAKLCGLELVDASATCSFYSDSDFLLVHDDQQDTRAVAFVLYLTGEEGWDENWGGALELFDRNSQNQPNVCTRRVIPKNNRLVLFPVSDHSYHQVNEVRSKNYCRLSINGWFHTKEPLKFETPTYEKPKCGILSDTLQIVENNEINLEDWVGPRFLNEAYIGDIQGYMEESSQLSLATFFNSNKMKRVVEVLNSQDLVWKHMGPPNRHNYEYLDLEQELPQILKNFLALFKSTDFMQLLMQYTHLELVNFRYELQKWTPGCYSLLGDQEAKNRLDLSISMGDLEVIGGKTQYVTLEDEVQQALVTIDVDGSLNLVYGDTAKYISFVSHQSKSKAYYTLTASYFETEEDDEN